VCNCTTSENKAKARVKGGAKAAKSFLGKALKGLKDHEKPLKITTDKAPTYGPAIAELKAEGKCLEDMEHRQVKYLNNVVEADHGKLKRLIKPTLGFKSMKTAYATLKGFEVMHALKKGQANVSGPIVRTGTGFHSHEAVRKA
jgi:transposase, IS6 family